MIGHKNYLTVFSLAVLLLGVFSFNGTVLAADSLPTDKGCKKIENPDAVMKGWCVAINRSKGNCLGCHQMVVKAWPEGFPPGGNIAPPLVGMKQRYPDKAELRQQIWDALSINPKSVMPPFGRHKLLSEQEIDNIVEFLLTI